MLVRLISMFFLLSLILSCSLLDSDASLPDCLQDLTEEHTSLVIKYQEVNGEKHYWLDTGANSFDADEYIVDENCDTVCYYGGWINPECINEYTGEWLIIVN